MAIKKDGSVIIDTLIDTKGFNKGVGNMQKSISGLTGTITKLGVAVGLAFSVKAVINFGKECINLGSDLQEVQNVVDVTFGNMSDKIDEFAKKAITQFGLSELAAKQYASTMGAMLKSMGFDNKSVLDMSTTLAGLAGDIASFYNLTGDEAFAKIRAGISGETEPLKQLGINLSVANLEAFALAEGITKSYNAMTEQEKAMLRYKYLLKTTADAQGDFARTSDSWANQTRILAEQFNSLKATIGQGLINVFTPVIKLLNTLLAKLQTVANAFKALTEQIFGKQETQKAATNLGAIEDEYNGIADATENAKKAQDKYLTGLDEIKTFQTQDKVGTGEIGGGLVDTGATGEINEDLEETDGILEKLEERFPRLMQFLEDVGAKLKEIVQDIKLGDFKELGGDISDLAIMFFDFLSESIDAVDWEGIGKKIGDFLAGIKWIDVIKSALKLKFNIWKAIAEVWFGSFKAAPIETTIMTALGLLKFTGLGSLLGNRIKSSLLTTLPGSTGTAFKSLGGLGGLLTTDLSTIFGAGTAAEIGLTIGTSIIGGIIAAIGGFNFGKWLGENLFPDDASYYENFKWFGEDGFFSTVFDDLETSFDALADMATDFSENPVIASLTNILAGPIGTAALQIKGHKEEIEEFLTGITDKSKEFGKKEKWEEAMGGIKEAFDNVWKGAVNAAISLVNKFIDYLNEKMHFEWDAFKDPLFGTELFPAGSIQLFTITKIPMLASGAVIPPNAPFMAMLGDQKHGTNIEAPLDTIKQAVREVVGNGGGGQYQFTAQINRRTLFDEMIEEAKLRQDVFGKNPFDLGKGVRA